MKNRITIFRQYTPLGTLGYIPEVGLWTIERPRKNNEKNVSCIPEGLYTLVRHGPTSVTLPKGWDHTFVLVNKNLKVTQYDQGDLSSRWGNVFHIANFSDDVEGCVGSGLDVRAYDGKLMVTHSGSATSRLLHYIVDNDIREVLITHGACI